MSLSALWRPPDMKHFRTIFRKELIDTIRDKRTLFFMIVFPLLLVPLILTVIAQVQISSIQKAEEKILRLGIVTNGNASALAHELGQARNVRLIDGIAEDSAEALINRDSLDAIIVVSRNFDNDVEELHSGVIRLYYKSSDDYDMVKRRVSAIVGHFEKSLMSLRFERLKLDKGVTDAVQLEEHDVASAKERFGKGAGGMLPYFFVIFCFMGEMYPAIDLAAGEKERGTIETLLTAPVSRFQILMGKFAVVVLAGILSALASLTGLFIAVRQIHEIPPDIVQLVLSILDARTIILVISLLLPLTVFFAAILLSLSIFSRSYKEAQSLITPISIVIILPVMLAIMPGTALDSVTAMIPVLNVSLATKEIIAGTIKPMLLMEVYGSLFALAALSLWGCAKWFGREETVFRGT
jgi:sodium transport system permease protein